MRHLLARVGMCVWSAFLIFGCDNGACEGTLCACNEEGIRAAVAAGGGPYTFACNAEKPVEIDAEILITKNVILDGEGNLVVVGAGDHTVFRVAQDVEAELRRLEVTAEIKDQASKTSAGSGVGIENRGTLALSDCTVRDNQGSGIQNFEDGTLTLTTCTVSHNGAGIFNEGEFTLTNSTVAEESTFINRGTLMATNSTLSNTRYEDEDDEPELPLLLNIGGSITLTSTTVYQIEISNQEPEDADPGTVALANTLIVGGCIGEKDEITSNGYNIESSGDTCTFETDKGDKFNQDADGLIDPELAYHGGPTLTHALPEDSEAVDHIPIARCVDANGDQLLTDQRLMPRPRQKGCDVGAFERGPNDPPDGAGGTGGMGGGGGTDGKGGMGGEGGIGGEGGAPFVP